MSTVEELQSKLDQANMNAKGLIAQLEATKQMFNESIQTSLQLRTNLHIFQMDNQDLAREKEEMQKQIETHKAQIIVMGNRILALRDNTPEPEIINPVLQT